MSVDVIPQQPRSRRAEFVVLSCVLLVGLLVRLPTMARPFQRDPEGCGAVLRHGRAELRSLWRDQDYAVPIQSIGVTPEAPVFYPNHPPLLPLLIAGVYGISGMEPLERRSADRVGRRGCRRRLFTLGCITMIFVMLCGNKPRQAMPWRRGIPREPGSSTLVLRVAATHTHSICRVDIHHTHEALYTVAISPSSADYNQIKPQQQGLFPSPRLRPVAAYRTSSPFNSFTVR
jgi:hypothetical protein